MIDAVLVADDEPGIRTSLAEVLRDAGYRVETAADGSAALEALEILKKREDARLHAGVDSDGGRVLRVAKFGSEQRTVDAQDVSVVGLVSDVCRHDGVGSL